MELKEYFTISGMVPDPCRTHGKDEHFVESARFTKYPTQEEIADYMAQVGMFTSQVSKYYGLTNPSEVMVLTIEDGEPKVSKLEEPDEFGGFIPDRPHPSVAKTLEVKMYEYHTRMGREPKALFISDEHRFELGLELGAKIMRGQENHIRDYRGIPIYAADVDEPMVGG